MNKEQYVPDMMGCSDGSCIFEHKPRGTMVTNGGCQCAKALMRSEEGQKAYRTIMWLRRQQPTPQADEIAERMPERVPFYEPDTYRSPTRTMLNKVNMIKDVRQAAHCSLKEAKLAVDAVYASCWEYDQVIEKAALHLKHTAVPRPRYDYSCERGDGCVCTGDTQGVRQTCGWYTGEQL